MQTFEARVVSVHAGTDAHLAKQEQSSISVELDGIVGDRHRGYTRSCWAGDKQAKGTVRRNERQWSAVSVEELTYITQRLELTEPLSAETLGANLCLEGIPEFSLLPKGTTLWFPSGAVLSVEEYNPPCADMGAQIASKYTTHSNDPLNATSWMPPAAGRRGLVGVIDVAGEIRAGDEVEVRVYEEPVIRLL